jgi:uncharacterized protein YbaR (Trm112 family)
MKPRLLMYLVCPKCSGELVCAAESQQGEDIITGQLTCEQCGKIYPVVRGIPRMLLESPPEVKKRTADNFGWEWQRFKALAHDLNTTQAQFLDWVWPLTADYFRGKIVVDAGCGMGRWPMVVSKLGAQEVLAFDLSNSVEAACDNLAAYPNVHIIQADIYHLPFRRARRDAGRKGGTLLDGCPARARAYTIPKPPEGQSRKAGAVQGSQLGVASVRHWLSYSDVMALYGDFIDKEQSCVSGIVFNRLEVPGL